MLAKVARYPPTDLHREEKDLQTGEEGSIMAVLAACNGGVALYDRKNFAFINHCSVEKLVLRNILLALSLETHIS
jgi:hypothetical protein